MIGVVIIEKVIVLLLLKARAASETGSLVIVAMVQLVAGDGEAGCRGCAEVSTVGRGWRVTDRRTDTSAHSAAAPSYRQSMLLLLLLLVVVGMMIAVRSVIALQWILLCEKEEQRAFC